MVKGHVGDMVHKVVAVSSVQLSIALPLPDTISLSLAHRLVLFV
jgi:hypothetical protein